MTIVIFMLGVAIGFCIRVFFSQWDNDERQLNQENDSLEIENHRINQRVIELEEE